MTKYWISYLVGIGYPYLFDSWGNLLVNCLGKSLIYNLGNPILTICPFF